MAGRADIQNPEELGEFRRAMIQFLERFDLALADALGGVHRAQEWLEQERIPQVRRRLLRCEERVSEARIALNAAKSRVGASGPASFEDEERAFKKARAQFEAAEALAQRIGRWRRNIDRECADGLNRVRRGRQTVEKIGPSAIARLDEMEEALQRYLRAQGGGGLS